MHARQTGAYVRLCCSQQHKEQMTANSAESRRAWRAINSRLQHTTYVGDQDSTANVRKYLACEHKCVTPDWAPTRSGTRKASPDRARRRMRAIVP